MTANLNATPSGERTHVTLYGRRNAGKSSLANALAGQEMSLVSAVKGTTTDPVWKAMEWLPMGPVVLTDTPGLDDEGVLGAERVRRGRETLARTDVAVLVLEAGTGFGACERTWLAEVKARGLPVAVVFNKCDEGRPSPEALAEAATVAGAAVFEVSCATGAGVAALREGLARLPMEAGGAGRLIGDLLSPGDCVVLVTPIDSAAPKGRLILPQQQVLRDAIDAGAFCVVVQDGGLRAALAGLTHPPALVVTDSQVFARVAAEVPESVPLTSFSILFARHKGDLKALMEGAAAVARLRDGDRVLMAEGCTHHRQADDIGTVKIPRWLREHTGKALQFEHTAGLRYPADLKSYALVVHCGGCMLTPREMRNRIREAQEAGVPVVNYGVLIAHLNGILPRCLAPLLQAAQRKVAVNLVDGPVLVHVKDGMGESGGKFLA